MGFSSEEFIKMREEMMNYNDYVMRQWEKRYTEPDDDPYEDMDDEEYKEMCERAEYEEGMLYEKYERERKQKLGE